MKMRAIVMSVIAVASIMASAASASAAPHAYCTGNYWWTWTVNDQDSACGIVLKRSISAGRSITRAYWGSYDTAARNEADLICDEGTRRVLGTGRTVFENARNMQTQLGWDDCVLRVR